MEALTKTGMHTCDGGLDAAWAYRPGPPGFHAAQTARELSVEEVKRSPGRPQSTGCMRGMGADGQVQNKGVVSRR